MDRRPRIGVTGNDRRWAPSWWCAALALRLAGAEPERISVSHPPSGRPLHGLIISGGNDISPEHYGGEIRAKVRHDPARDDLEIHWITKAMAENLPMLGICRGAQLINVVLGGNLYEDIRALRNKTHNRPGLLPTKQVQLTDDGRLHTLLGTRKLRVNSLHHQAIRDTGDRLEVEGVDLDDIVQAVVYNGERDIIGVQWHPEYLFYVPAQLKLFRWLVERAGDHVK